MNHIKMLSQQRLSLLLALYIGILLNIPVFYRRFTPLLAHSATSNGFSALVEVVAIVLLTFFLMRLLSLGGKRLCRVLTTLLVLTSVAAAYYMAFFNVVIGYGIVASVLSSDIDLSKEVVGYQFAGWMVLLSALPLWLIWRAGLSQPLSEQLRTRGQRVKALTVMLLAAALVWLPVRYLDKVNKIRDRLANVDLPSYGGVLAHSYLPTNWFSALGLFVWTRIDELLGDKVLLDPAKKYRWVAPPGIDDTYLVFVIGETTRWDHMGIFGYQRDNTPGLSREENLVAFRGTSCDTATKLSLRCMFVREGGTKDNPGRTLKEENLFSVLKSLGFSSELFAMQGEVWFYDSVHADNFLFREQIGSEKRNQGKPVDDMLLVPELKDSLQRYPQGKHLVVLHTKGSHYLYSLRYPRSYARYQPECMGADIKCSQQQLINAFDNSVLYIDNMLVSVFDQLRDKKAIVFYAADHGESMSDDMHLHGTPREMAPPEQFRVPLIVWASDKYLADDNHRRAFERLRAQQRAGKTHRQVELFDSVLGCLGYSSPDGGINAANNWCQAPAESDSVSDYQ